MSCVLEHDVELLFYWLRGGSWASNCTPAEQSVSRCHLSATLGFSLLLAAASHKLHVASRCLCENTSSSCCYPEEVQITSHRLLQNKSRQTSLRR